VLVGVALSLASADASVAHAQIIRPNFRTNPIAWTSLSIGWLQQQGFNERDTGAGLDFGSGPQWRASLEMPMGNGGSSFGIMGTLARMPLVYRGSVLTANSCAGCDADANVSQIMGVLHMGGSTGFHQVIDAGAGVTMFSNVRATDGTRLGTGKTNTNFSFAIGYGFGYGFSPRASVMIVQDLSLILLKRESGSSDNTAQQSNLRLGFRYGLGEKGTRY
jgi:hypothetical protein